MRPERAGHRQSSRGRFVASLCSRGTRSLAVLPFGKGMVWLGALGR